MKIIDLNVLLYAINRDSAHHETVRTWWESALSGDERSDGASPASTILFMAGMWQGKTAGSRGGRGSAPAHCLPACSVARAIRQRQGKRSLG